ncbi:hypothetical protein HPMG_01347 [Helicobacter pullorum MIT 98-5489]|uniref:Uncharacterized protein n=1 Tax=Helicobacter pullorum MIT 98-5489 TaxID=537972 RepID=C5F0Y6_9HELI|nr:hypothetical protein [Helicobacter pullorum]EEQ63890.1 hypothetical protein HPMG_01347 [Helicobacter pullorum MIT 98-5489]
MITLSNGLSLSFATNLALEAKKDSNGTSLSAIARNNYIEINDETLKKHELQMKTDAILNGTKSYFYGEFLSPRLSNNRSNAWLLYNYRENLTE